MAILALDIGRKRVGVALSQSKKLVRAAGVFNLAPWSTFVVQLKKLIEREGVTTLVVGQPTGVTGEFVQKTVAKLKRELTLPLFLIEEEETTREAQARQGSRHDHADDLAAQIILERYLETVVTIKK